MNSRTLKIAANEAYDFLERARAVQQLYVEKPYWPHSGAETGALRRKSMDLTRALAAMRKP